MLIYCQLFTGAQLLIIVFIISAENCFFLLICFYYIFVKTILYVFQDSLMDRKGEKRIYLFLNVFIVIINVFADTL